MPYIAHPQPTFKNPALADTQLSREVARVYDGIDDSMHAFFDEVVAEGHKGVFTDIFLTALETAALHPGWARAVLALGKRRSEELGDEESPEERNSGAAIAAMLVDDVPMRSPSGRLLH